LLGVDDDHRGNGIGMALLEANLTRFDAEGVPTYLESSNSANDHRYEARGYRRIGEFTPPGSDNVIAAYWRDPAQPPESKGEPQPHTPRTLKARGPPPTL